MCRTVQKPSKDKGYERSTKRLSCLSDSKRKPDHIFFHCERGSKSEAKCVRNRTTKKTGPHTSTSLEEKFLASCQNSQCTSWFKRTNGRTNRKHHARLPAQCQPPACQRVPVATIDRSRRTQCQTKKTGNIEKTTAWAHKST